MFFHFVIVILFIRVDQLLLIASCCIHYNLMPSTTIYFAPIHQATYQANLCHLLLVTKLLGIYAEQLSTYKLVYFWVKVVTLLLMLITSLEMFLLPLFLFLVHWIYNAWRLGWPKLFDDYLRKSRKNRLPLSYEEKFNKLRK